MRTFSTIILSAVASMALAQNPNPIKVNQVGYYPTQEKTASIEQNGFAKKYKLQDASTKKTVWKGKATRTAKSPWSDKERAIIDFSSVNKPGEYILTNGKDVQQVIIKDNTLHELAVASMKAFYLNRCSEPILKEYAGEYARPAGHPDNKVLIHPSAASESRPEGTIISSPGGWYDAGDYNKYIVNSGFSVGLMLDAYEMNKSYFDKFVTNIPESKNSIPDYLDEIMVNIKWMQTMQDPEDGGVYHKLTTPNFEGFVKPTDCKQTRYVVHKTTAASLDFAATLAKASRIYGQYPEYREWAEAAIIQAEKAFEWATKNPKVYYRQAEMNKNYSPKVNTGAYDDYNVSDEFVWAAAELAVSTMNAKYVNVITQNASSYHYSIPSWGNVGGLTAYTAIGLLNTYPDFGPYNFVFDGIKKEIVAYADSLVNTTASSCYQSPCGNSPKNYHWGCLAESFCGQGITLLYAYRLTGDKKYLTGALQAADYLLGRNATGYCYVTGFGTYKVMNPHQRLSASDNIKEPLPGFLVGGPNPGQQDKNDMKEKYTSNLPDESYLDASGSYASNEIAINWNAALAAFICWLDAELK